MLMRYASALTSGALATFALLYAMQGLIGLVPATAADAREPHYLEWIRLLSDDTSVRTDERLFDKHSLTDVPEPPQGGPPTAGEPGFHVAVPSATPGPVMTGPGTIDNPDSPLIAIVRVQPVYPVDAAQRRLEGWVDVRFDVLTNGLAANIEVVRSSHRVFERAAIRAAQRFRFKAPVVDGVPRVANGVGYRFRFKMDD